MSGGALFHGFEAGYLEPGPSGLITRGKHEILPTRRNFYSPGPVQDTDESGVEDQGAAMAGKQPRRRSMTGSSMTSHGRSCSTARCAGSMRRIIPMRSRRSEDGSSRGQRGLWDADPDVLDGRTRISRWGAGSIDVVTAGDIAGWKAKIGEILVDA